METSRERLEKAFAPLMNLTERQIAEFLNSQGITGNRRAADSCPIACFIKKQLGIPIDKRFTVVTTVNYTVFEKEQINHSYELRSFIHSFDYSKYPNLERK